MAASILTEGQQAFLEEFFRGDAERHGFFLSGGTALAAYHLEHRFSEDLDLFTRLDGEVDWGVNEALSVTTRLGGSLSWRIRKPTFAEAGALLPPFSSPPIETKIQLVQDVVNSRLDEPLRVGRIVVDSLLDIAVNKVLCIYQREELKDFVDLYFILRDSGLTLDGLISLSDRKEAGFDPLVLAAQMSRIPIDRPRPRMIKSMPWDQMRQYFDRDAKRLAGRGRPAGP